MFAPKAILARKFKRKLWNANSKVLATETLVVGFGFGFGLGPSLESFARNRTQI